MPFDTIKEQLDKVLRQSPAYSGDERVRKEVDAIFPHLIELGEGGNQDELLNVFRRLQKRLMEIYAPSAERASELTPENKAFVEDLVDRHYGEAVSTISTVMWKTGDPAIPAKTALRNAIMNQLTNEQVVELQKLKDPAVLMMPEASPSLWAKWMDHPECQKNYGGEPQKNADVSILFFNALRQIAIESGVTEDDRITGYHFVITEGARIFEASPEDFDAGWNQSKEMKVQDRIEAFLAYYDLKKIQSLNAPAYMVLMIQSLRKGQPIDPLNSSTLLPGEPLSAHMMNGCVLQGLWSWEDTKKVVLNSRPCEEEAAWLHLRAAVSGKIEATTEVEPSLPNTGELPPLLPILDSYANLSPERIREDLEQQYQNRLLGMRYFQIIDNVNLPAITDISGNERHAPSFDQIWKQLSQNPEKLEKIKGLKKPTLILTPFGMPLKSLAERVESKNGRLKKEGVELHQKPIICPWDENDNKEGLSFDIINHIAYFPKRFHPTKHGGKSKLELLYHIGTPFPGWQVTIMEGEQEIQVRNKSDDAFLQEWKGKKYCLVTPEETLMLHAEGIVAPFENQNGHYSFNSDCRELCLGAFLPGNKWIDDQKTGAIPACGFLGSQEEAALSLGHKHIPLLNAFSGPRRGVRIF